MATTKTAAPSVEKIRVEMRRKLTTEERKAYRGITMSAMAGTKYDELFGFKTAEELIIAESYGRQAVASDDSSNIYVFSAGHGLTARLNHRYAKTFFESQGRSDVSPVAPKTIEQLHMEYRAMQRPTRGEEVEHESLFQKVASDFVDWWNELQSSGMSQQEWYRQNHGQACEDPEDCQ